MSGSNYLLDTNILVYALKGLPSVKPYFEESCFISVITEIEILGVPGLSKKEYSIRRSAIDFCTIIPLTTTVKNEAIRLKQQFKVKLPDAVIAATALIEGYTLVTADKAFSKYSAASVILINP
ncbi:MAG: type II toxin-antitoxin system VapC family toxin [Sphingobacteriales bacterium]|nr:type II toxin-antitoxin system VapC family toxin [Sphingobacteriales bacterium]